MTPGNSSDEHGELARMLEMLAGTRMPFGKYGPRHVPPDGVPVYDLPYEYLAWFARKGFPRNSLGAMMEFVYKVKQDGGDAMFDPLRQRSGGRTNLRRKRQRHWTFEDENEGDDGSEQNT